MKTQQLSKQETASIWFQTLQDKICQQFLQIEIDFARIARLTPPTKFTKTKWERNGGGGGQMAIMRGNVFEKVGVNFSAVHGEFNEKMKQQIPGADEADGFYATGISVVAHPQSPLVAASHFNTRFIETSKNWFGGGADLTPTFADEAESRDFHSCLKKACDEYDENYYPKFKKECDEYFFLKHRNEPRGIGGIFFDYLNNNDFELDLSFIQTVGNGFAEIYPKLVRNKMHLQWTEKEKEKQLIKRGRYVEFNLLQDRGTRFGIETGGNIEAILMSMPPTVKWP